MKPPRPNALFTLGYEGLEVDAFIARLVAAGARFVVDVRELPLSRKKGFSKSALGERLRAAGIAYAHVRALGCPKRIRDRYRVRPDWSAYTRDFLAYLTTQRAAVKELAVLAQTSTVCLICFEADYTTCHRAYVARAAHAVGAPSVRHLTAEIAQAGESLRQAA